MLTRRGFFVGAAVALSAAVARADDIPSPVPGKRVALRGNDPVGYFTDGRPIPGVAQYWYEFDDTVYLFASAEHRALFVADPDHYAPQFRGFCAMSLAFGEQDEGLPDSWKIVDGKLFMFGRPSGPQDFAADEAGFTARANATWAATHPK
jgi:YHS domain-containing protein